jgi:hypothetical protein
METRYKRLARARPRSSFAVAFMSRSSLWLGDDHLLCVDSNGYSETYKRFYFHDIQTFTVRKTKRRLIWNWLLAIPAAFCIADLSTNRTLGLAGIITVATIALIFAVPLLINNLLGSTCACQLRTAVQVEELPSLARVRQARKVLKKVLPLIAATQGQLGAEEISTRMREASQQAPSTIPQPPPAETSGTPPILS